MNVPQLAARHNGHTTWAFSQNNLSVWKHYRTLGICAALSAEWIKHHAHDGTLVSSLGGGGLGPLNIAKLKEIAILHRTASSDGGDGQREQLRLWLQMHGIVSLNTSRSVSVTSFRTGGRAVATAQTAPAASQETSSKIIPTIEYDIANAMAKYRSCYARVNFGGTVFGKGAGHAIAVWLGQPTYSSRSGDAMMFDPNYGEYWFENKDDFIRFFPEFYRGTYRSTPMSFNKNWEVLPCARKVI